MNLKINDEGIMKILQSEGIAIKEKIIAHNKSGEVQEVKQTKEKFSFLAVLKSY